MYLYKVFLVTSFAQKFLGHFSFLTSFCVEFATNRQFTLIKHGFNRPPMLVKFEVHNLCTICKFVWLLTLYTVGEWGWGVHFPYMKDKVSQMFWPGLHHCIRRTFNGTKRRSLSQHQSVIDKGKVYAVLLPFNKTINNWTILVDTDLMLFFYFSVSGSSPFVQWE